MDVLAWISASPKVVLIGVLVLLLAWLATVAWCQAQTEDGTDWAQALFRMGCYTAVVLVALISIQWGGKGGDFLPAIS